MQFYRIRTCQILIHAVFETVFEYVIYIGAEIYKYQMSCLFVKDIVMVYISLHK